MKGKINLVVILLVIIIAAILFVFKSKTKMETNMMKTNTKENTDVKVPNLVLYDQYGKEHNLEEYKGKVVIINFWATWCGYCIEEMPAFEKVYKEFGSNEKDVIFLGVAGPKSKENLNNIDVEKEEVIKFLNENKITYPNLMDETGKSFSEYGIRAFPTTYVINKSGKLEGSVSGAISEEQLRKTINEALKKK